MHQRLFPKRDTKVRGSSIFASNNISLSPNFHVGGIEKNELVRTNGGVPLLKDIPLLGWVFSTERESLKKTQLIVVADCEIVLPETEVTPPAMEFKHAY